jgi:peroxiredoxin
MTIKVGDRLPDATFKVKTGDTTADVTAADYFAGKKVVLFGVPGAFTPTCHLNHMPGFIQHNAEIRAKGVDKVAVVSTNDHHVMAAWRDATGGEGKIDYLADGNAAFAKALGLDNDMSSGPQMGTRFKRFSMIVENGVVKELNIEGVPGKVTNSGAETILTQL